MPIKSVIKKILVKLGLLEKIKNSSIVYPYRKYQLIKRYASKNNIGFFKSLFSIRITKNDYNKIFNLVEKDNIGEENFFYCLDDKLLISNSNRIIDNIPIDYSYIINHEIGNSEIENVIKKYVSKINDSRISINKPTNLEEALQSILFWNSLLWQTGHRLVGLGRLDKVLSSFDVPNNAEELINNFLLTLHRKFDFKSNVLKGDTGQIIILGGLEENGSYFRNDYTDLFIKCIKNLNLPDPKVLLRCSANMPLDLLELAMDCVSTGIGSPIFSNDDIVIPKLIEFGYEKKDAYNYGVSACWEPLSIGNSLEQNNIGNIEYGKYINETIQDDDFVNCKNIDDVISLYYKHLKKGCDSLKQTFDSINWEKDPLLTLMMGLNKDISEGGAKYNNYGTLSVGMSSAVNSLLNIDRYVFKDRKFRLEEIQEKIRNNDVEFFEKNENGFGTESLDAIDITNRIIKETENNLKDYRNKFGGKVKFGLSSPSYITASYNVGATLDGRKAGSPFSTHISRDKGEPITEIINFESKLDFSGISCNANVIDIMIQPSLIKDNINKFALYILGGIKKGMFQLQMNVLSYKQLVDARFHPEKYPNLIVRVWGFSAYFNDLPEEYKDNLIKRAKEMETNSI